MKDINGLSQKRQGVFREWLHKDDERQQAWNAVGRLSEKLMKQRVIGDALTAVGAALSGGTASAVAGAVGDAIGIIGSLLGFSPLRGQLVAVLKKVESLSWEFETQLSYMNYLDQQIGEMHETRKKLRCIGF